MKHKTNSLLEDNRKLTNWQRLKKNLFYSKLWLFAACQNSNFYKKQKNGWLLYTELYREYVENLMIIESSVSE